MINTSHARSFGYVTYLSVNFVASDELSREVSVRDPQLHAQEAPENVFAFFYYNVSSITFDVDDRAVFMTSERHTLSGRYFIDGEVLTIDQVRATNNATSLLEMMQFHGWRAVVKTRAGHTVPFDPDKDKVIYSK